MNLYLIYQNVNNTYDTYDSAVVAAGSSAEATFTHPDGRSQWSEPKKTWYGVREDGSIYDLYDGDWARPDQIKVKLIGTAGDGITGVICASYHDG